jgi:hypothetical protein
MDLKNAIIQKGISIIVFNAKDEHKAETIIKLLTGNKILSVDFDVIYQTLENLKDVVVYVDAPIQLIKVHNSNPSHNSNPILNAKYRNIFLRKLVKLCINNNLCIIFKSYINTSAITPHNIPTLSGSEVYLYTSNFVGIIDGDTINVKKSRYCEPKNYSIQGLLLKSQRKEKILQLNKTIK